MKPWLAFVACVLAAGCGAGRAHAPDGSSPSALTVRPVAWNAANVPVGKVRAVADAGDVAAVLADDGAHVFTAGAQVATDEAVKDWIDADTIVAPDGSGRWIIAVDARGKIFHMRGRSSFEDVSERFGLSDKKVRGAAVLAPDYVAFLLDGEVALADGQRVARYATPALRDLVGGGGFGAGVVEDGVVVFTAGQRAVRRYALREATHAALGADGRLYVTTPRAVYASNAVGTLDLVYETPRDTIHGLVVSSDHVWFADGTELGVVDGDRVSVTSGIGIAADGRLAPSSTGDVWVLSQGKLTRFARVDPEATLAQAWNASLSGVFARSCSSCHLPGGPSGVDLSTAEQWHTHRAAIIERVLSTKSMPPTGRPLADPDRAAIEAWSKAAH